MATKRVELGDTFTCTCGEPHKIEGMWLAAHWSENLTFTCTKCERVFDLVRGLIFPRRRTRQK